MNKFMSSLFVLFLFLSQTIYSQTHAPTTELNNINVYLDCQYCDNGYIKQNVNNVVFVRDAKQADVHVLFMSQASGGGGTSEKIQFIGLGIYKVFSDILTYATTVDMSESNKRELRLKYLELGLIRYRIEAGQLEDIKLEISQSAGTENVVPNDPWNSWVFSMNANGSFNGQETSNTVNLSGGGAAKRITEESKFLVSGGFRQNRTFYNYNGIKTTSMRRSSWGNIQEVISMNDHWSLGFFGNAGNSIFSNYQLYLVGKTGIEYDLFEYSESFNKQAIVAYNLGARYNNYYDTTVFNQVEDKLVFQELAVGGKVKQNWGNLSSTVTYQNYLHDFSLNSVSLWLNLKVRLFKGFSWRVNGSFKIRKNQVNIARQSASIEDVLLQQQELGTGYSYWMNTGINYSFGSMYNSVVNPRFNM